MPATPSEPPHKRLRTNPYARATQAHLTQPSSSTSALLPAPSNGRTRSNQSDTASIIAGASGTPSQDDKKRKKKQKSNQRKHSITGNASPVKENNQIGAQNPERDQVKRGTAIFDQFMNMKAPLSPRPTGLDLDIDIEMDVAQADETEPRQVTSVSNTPAAQPGSSKAKKKKEKKEKRKLEKRRAESPSKGKGIPTSSPQVEQEKEEVKTPAAGPSSVKVDEKTQPIQDDLHIKSQMEEEKKARAARDLAQVREEARRREAHQKELQAVREEAAKWKAEAEKEKKAREDREKDFEALMDGLEKQIEVKKQHTHAQEVVIKDHEQTKSALKEAVECGVCLMTVDDPYILSCGHMACKGCLVEWFRTPGAYQSEIFEPITPETDLSHRVKVCHVCRAAVIRRPARVFFLRAILEPLGLYEQKDAPLPSSQMDIWDKIFPIERESYKVYDEQDGVWRCPTCGGEIDEGLCSGCGISFSDNEADAWDDDDVDSESDVVGSILGDGPIVIEGARRGRGLPNFLDDEAEDDEGNFGSSSSSSSSSNSDIEVTGSAEGRRQGRARSHNQARIQQNGSSGSLRDRARNNPGLAGIFSALDAIEGGALNRDNRRQHRRDRVPAFLRSDDEEGDDSEDDENDLDHAGESVGYAHSSAEEGDIGPPGSEDEYGGSFIDDGGDEDEDLAMLESDEDGEIDGGLSGSEEESVTGQSSRRRRGGARDRVPVRGGPPPRVRTHTQSDEDSSDGPQFTRLRRRQAPVVVSDSEDE